MQPSHIIIADDHQMFAQSVSRHLRERFGVVTVVHCGAELLRLLERTEADCLLLDHRLKDIDGIDLLPAIRAAAPRLKVIALTMYNHPALVHRYRQAGAAGFVVKDDKLREIERAIRCVLAGGPFHESPGVARVRRAAEGAAAALPAVDAAPPAGTAPHRPRHDVAGDRR